MKPSIAERLHKLKVSFIDQLPTQLKNMREALACLDIPSEEKLEDLHRRIHTLKGAAASFGLQDLSIEANKGEELVKTALKETIFISNHWLRDMIECLAIIEREINCISPEMTECRENLNVVKFPATDDQDRKRLVYLCEDDPIQCSSLATQIGCFGFKVIAFKDLEGFRRAVCKQPPDVIVMDMIHHDQETGGSDVIQQIIAEQKIIIPVVFISASSELTARIAAVRAGANAYFVKPVNPSALCSTLQDLTTTENPEPYRIMIVDDDLYLSEMYSWILRDAGMDTRILNDPMQTLSLLSSFKPDLILMDMHMPGCNGMELAKAIRQMEAYIGIPIVFLSSEADVDLHFDARKMGGDEFLIKPIQPNHLISAVSVRAERMKLIRSFMCKDSMTGLYNHSAIKEHLTIYMEQAKRNRENICYAMIDIDHFKSVNDTYGHPVGDKVLIALARLLKQRLRKSDVLGRYGGEEFAAILPACSLNDAVVLLDQLRKNYSAISFTAGQTAFCSSFSCGVAPLSSYPEIDQLCKAADDALYAAKRDGRNRVMAAPCSG